MPPTSPFLAWYLPRRRAWEAGLWIAFLGLQVPLNALVKLMDLRRTGADVAPWQPFLWEFSSVLLLVALMPALLAFERRYPLRFDTLRRSLPIHLLGTVAFSIAHVVGMVLIRQGVHALAGERYEFGPWGRELFYEYLKDVRFYALFFAVVLTYRWVLLRAQGEARLLVEPDAGPPVEPVDRPERFLVRKLGAEFLVAARDIEWLEASENYVNLHVRGHVYPLRSTMNAIEKRLDPKRFVRVHRRYVVNLDHLERIQPLETGDARLLMKDGTTLACSRTYRAALKDPVLVAG
jgi:hypothetical protein